MKDYLKIIRPVNLLFIIILMGLMEKFVVRGVMLHYQLGEPLTWWVLLLLIVATVCIAAGGYVINDYFDVKIDAINRPERLIVTRGISKQQAMRYFQLLTGVGVICGVAVAIVLRSMPLGLTFVIVPGILWFYSASYKRQFLLGNLTVAFLAAMVPMLIGFACDAVLKKEFGADSMLGQYLVNKLYLWLAGFAAFAFLTTWAREIIKDIEDQDGDRELECHTIAVMYGETVAKVVATVLIVVIMALVIWVSLLLQPKGMAWSNLTTRYCLLMEVGFAGVIALLWAAKLPQDYHKAQGAMKAMMLIGSLYAVCI